jgi:hypothetical protein
MFGPVVYHVAVGALNVTPITNILDQITTAVQVVGVPMGALAAGFGGLMQSQMFHSDGAHQKGKDVMRYGIYGMIALGLGPQLMRSLAGAVGAVGRLHGLPLM